MVWPEENTTDQRLTALEHACRSTVGDRLRSVSVDSPEWSGTVYQRSDLRLSSSGSEESRLADETAHDAVVDDDAVLADGGRTVEEFADGYVAHFQHGEMRVVATAGGLKMDREDELTAAIRGVFSG